MQAFSLERAIEIAITAHEGQVDKQGLPYILHPMRVMSMMEGVDVKIVAALHDTIEDTWVTGEYLLQEGCPKRIVDSVVLLSHAPEYNGNHEEYFEKIRKICESGDQWAIDVKFADNTDNLDPLRIDVPTERDYVRWAKYKQSREMLRPFVSSYLKGIE